jgi:hypothetical protein
LLTVKRILISRFFPDAPVHANIKKANGESIPNKSQDPPTAFQIADDLMERSRPVTYWEAPDADILFQAELKAKREQKQRGAVQ